MKLRPFELAMVIIFVVLGLTSLALLSSFNGSGGSGDELAVTGPVQIWGVLPGQGMQETLFALSEQDDSYAQVSYRHIPRAEFNDVLVNALADGVGPDIIMMSHEQLVEMRRRITPYSYEVFPQRDIRDLYIEGAQIFGLSDGLYALPIAVDPLVMYWNRDILATEGYLEAPRTWEDLLNNQFDDLIQRDFNRSIRRGVVAMGEYGNVRNSFAVLSMLLTQSGSAGVSEAGTQYEIGLTRSLSGGGNPMRTGVDFYTRFSQPTNSYYSWNSSFGEDRSAFVGEQLAFYFGFASEAREIERLNPNLNFDITEVPQGSAASVRRTYGQFYGLALLRNAPNPRGAYSVMARLNETQVAGNIAMVSNLAPASRQLVSAGSSDTYGRIAFRSAAISYGWLNPSPSETDQIFATMISDVSSNRGSVNDAVLDAVERLEEAY